MSELRAGGLALVTRAAHQENIGRVVTLVGLISPGEDFYSPSGIFCRWSSQYPAAWLVSGNVSAGSKKENSRHHGWAVFLPSQLMPIDGHDFTEEEREKEKVG